MQAKAGFRIRVDIYLDATRYLRDCDEQNPDLPPMTHQEKQELVEEQVRQVLEHAPWREYFGVEFNRRSYEVIEAELVEQPEVIGCPGR